MKKHTNKKATILLIDLLIQNGVKDFIISPGSRNAPLILELQDREELNLYSIADERSAAFIALGMYLATGSTVAILCTSGSALLNYAPAIAEAFYQGIPLIAISADRPSYWVDQGEGQTIRQKGSLSNHIKEELNIPLDGEGLDYKNLSLQIDASIKLSSQGLKGPIHINIEYEEPLYDELNGAKPELFQNEVEVQNEIDLNSVLEGIDNYKRIIVLCGQLLPSKELNEVLESLAKEKKVLVLTESTSNLSSEHFVPSIDKTLFNLGDKKMDHRPDLLITIGDAVISKMIKKYFRSCDDQHHWQIHPGGVFRDTYKKLSRRIELDPSLFFVSMNSKIGSLSGDLKDVWMKAFREADNAHSKFIDGLEFCDLKVFSILNKEIPHDSILHLSNSSVIRYHQLFSERNNEVYCNRGTSGIDGSSSTALGYALKSEKQNYLISGDISFLYDSNAWFNSYHADLKIILINNGGGGIFRIIPGPKSVPNFETYFESSHNVIIHSLCKAYGIEYLAAENEQELSSGLKELQARKGIVLLEVFTPQEKNDLRLKEYFTSLQEHSS